MNILVINGSAFLEGMKTEDPHIRTKEISAVLLFGPRPLKKSHRPAASHGSPLHGGGRRTDRERRPSLPV